ncbi:RHS repeat protein, partial [Lysobacter pythonis]
MFFPNGDVYHFDDYGNVTSIKNARDPRRNITLTYSGLGADLRLTAMTDISGRSVQLSYMSGRLSSILLPTGQTITYGYDVRANLTSVDYGNGQVKQYVYGESGLAPNGDAGLLTGIISEDGKRYGTFGYDEYGRVISSVLHGENGPTESTDLRFPDATHTVVKTMTGELQTYAFTSDQYRRPLSIASNARSESSTYDSHGRKLSHTDGRGVQTTYAYNASGQLSQQIEAANDTTGDKRTTQTDWHATLNVPVARRVLDAAGQWVSQ